MPPIVDPRATVHPQFRRAAEILDEKNRTDHVLHTPDKLTCYLHEKLAATYLSWNTQKLFLGRKTVWREWGYCEVARTATTQRLE